MYYRGYQKKILRFEAHETEDDIKNVIKDWLSYAADQDYGRNDPRKKEENSARSEADENH